jgi:hypothetical protein
VVEVEDGGRRTVCDPRCPLTFQEETGRAVHLLRVTDYNTGERFDAKEAYYVVASDVAPDAHTQALRASPAETAYLHWHRCLPSVLAFRREADARNFQREHGGKLSRLADLGFAAGAEAPAAAESSP